MRFDAVGSQGHRHLALDDGAAGDRAGRRMSTRRRRPSRLRREAPSDRHRTLGNGVDLLVGTDTAGRVLAQAGRLRMPDVPAAHAAIAGATRGHEVVSLWRHPGGVIQVVSVPGVLYFPQFDVYYDGRLLPNSVGDPRTARRTVLELLLLVGVYDISALPILNGQWPSTWFEWTHAGCAALAAVIAVQVGIRWPAAGRRPSR